MFISCDCSIDYDEASEFDHVEVRKAKKTHTCVECSCMVTPGERYESWTVLDADGWKTYKTCLGCSRIRQHLSQYGWYWGGLAEQVAECIGFNYVTGEST